MRFFPAFIACLLALSTTVAAQTSRKIKLTPVSLGFNLPESYKQRTFIKGLSGFVNKMDRVGGEVYSSSDQFKVDYIVSVDLVSLEKLLSLQNCNDLINSEEIARREKAEQARLLA